MSNPEQGCSLKGIWTKAKQNQIPFMLSVNPSGLLGLPPPPFVCVFKWISIAFIHVTNIQLPHAAHHRPVQETVLGAFQRVFKWENL